MADLIAAQFLIAPNGTNDFGEVTADTAAAMGTRPGPIRLQHGYEGPKGYGNRHVEAYTDRMKQLSQIGYGTFGAFAFDVAQRYQRVLEGEPADRFLLVYRRMCNGYLFDLRVIVQPAEQDGLYFYSITTGIFSRVARGRQICEVKARKGGSVPTPGVAEKHPRFETLSLPKRSVSGGNGS